MSSEDAGWGRHGLVPQGVSLVLSALLVLSPGWATWTAAEDASNGASSGALSIATDPPGASTYIDGQFVGATPLNVDRLAAGDHRVRVVKGGYLENGRIVQVSAGKSSRLHVKLTPHSGDASAASQIVTGGGGGGGSKKWLWIGLAGGGAAIAAATLVGRNKAPTAGSVVASPSTALAGHHRQLHGPGRERPRRRQFDLHLGLRRRHDRNRRHSDQGLHHRRHVHGDGNGQRRQEVGDRHRHGDGPEPHRHLERIVGRLDDVQHDVVAVSERHEHQRLVFRPVWLEHGGSGVRHRLDQLAARQIHRGSCLLHRVHVYRRSGCGGQHPLRHGERLRLCEQLMESDAPVIDAVV